MLYCCFIKSSIALWRIPLLTYCPSCEEGKEVIKNDFEAAIKFAPCICEAGNRSSEELERRCHGVMAELREILQLQLEGK